MTEEDEAFDEIARKQGHWGGGFMAKRAMAADKLQEQYDQTALELCNVCGWKTLIPDDGCLNCERAQPVQEPLHIVQSNGKHSPLLTHMMSKRTTPPAAPVQEPTGMLHIDRLGQWLDASLKERKRPWVGLTDDEVYKIAFSLQGEHWRKVADAIEAKLKEKNFD